VLEIELGEDDGLNPSSVLDIELRTGKVLDQSKPRKEPAKAKN
jgi:hypothetical protein